MKESDSLFDNNLLEQSSSTEIKTDDYQGLAFIDEIKNCRRCNLYQTALTSVVGQGSLNAKLMIIGEAPGREEDIAGLPFVGRAGKLLTKTLNQMGVSREVVYICNILKHRPPNNRNPLDSEIKACTPFLMKQIEMIHPLVLLTLGSFSTQFILQTKEKIGNLRGNVYLQNNISVIPAYHPAAILRNPNLTPLFAEDIKKALIISNIIEQKA